MQVIYELELLSLILSDNENNKQQIGSASYIALILLKN